MTRPPPEGGAPVRAVVITVSDGVAAGTREDRSGETIVSWLAARGSVLSRHIQLPDAAHRIAAAMIEIADAGSADVIITTGGTGLTARDITPEATRAVIQREAPGISERIRAAGLAATPHAVLSRGMAGVRGSTLIINLPGSPGGVRDGLAVLNDIIDHAVQLLRGVNTELHPHDDG